MKKILALLMIVQLGLYAFAEGGYNVGDKASDFSLKNVDGKMVSLADYSEAKGFVVVFTCNHCPFAVAWEDRLIAIDDKYSTKGYPVVAINPNDPDVSPGDSFDKMKVRAKEKAFPYPYLFDAKQEVYKAYGATRTPHVYVLQKKNDDLKVAYIGAVDDNHKDASAVEKPYLANALDALIAGEKPDPDFTKAIGCTIKHK